MPERCDGDRYLDIVDPETGGVIGPRPCPGCPDCGLVETCVCGHQADEHDANGECQAPDCPCWAIELDPDAQTAPEVDWT